jgi:ferredoxin
MRCDTIPGVAQKRCVTLPRKKQLKGSEAHQFISREKQTVDRCYEPDAENMMMIGGRSMSHDSMQHIPLSSAYLCQDCNAVGNCSKQCPACASSVLMALATVLDREEEYSRVLAFDYREALAA